MAMTPDKVRTPDASADASLDDAVRFDDRMARASTGVVRRNSPRIVANLLVVAVFALWWWKSRTASPLEWPDPFDVFPDVGTLLWGRLRGDTIATFQRVVISVAIAMVIGSALALLARATPFLRPSINGRLLPMFNSMPALGWAIFGVIWFGISDFSVIFVEITILIPFAMVNLSEGMSSLDRDLIEMGRSFTRRRSKVMFRIEFPLLLPYLFAALRLSFGVGFKVALIAEFFGARDGLGLVMNRARQNFDTQLVYATILAVMLIVFVIDRFAFEPIGRHLNRRAGTGEIEHAEQQLAAQT